MLESSKSILSKILFLCIVSFLLIGNTASAQSFKLLRYDENYEFLKDSNRNFYERLKFIPLNQDKDVYMSIGGEARYEYVDFNNEDWGRFNIGHNNFLLQRYDLHADVHLGKRVRIFAQLRSALEDGRVNGARGIDEDQLNVQNLFVDVNVWQQKDKKITVRAGRQELDYGSGRLISVREGSEYEALFYRRKTNV
ncbi:alginate export family protein [Flavobacterium sp. MMS24-S5]|uniref:alginate export family protein n=1 Tax=Flavobacterium sp. MMS24-S5 TaxID=3416605 RepID=UPI003CFCC572